MKLPGREELGALAVVAAALVAVLLALGAVAGMWYLIVRELLRAVC